MTAAEAWVASVVALGGAPETAATGARDLSVRYAEPHRRYHLTAHVDAVVTLSAQLAEAIALDQRERHLLALAACAHDVIYDARPGDDERASSAWARAHLGAAGLDDEDIARVEALVLMTLDHEAAADDAAGEILLDADLSILGADESTYDGYVRAVRQEFGGIPDELWRAGRAAVLASLEVRSPLFITAAAQIRWEAAAHANLRRELATLGSSTP